MQDHRPRFAARSTPDAAVTWSYPYDATVFPRGLNAPELQWEGGTDADLVYVHVTSPYYEYESFGTALSGRFSPDGPDWQQLVDSTSGDTEIKVSRLAGGAAGAATVVKDQHWSIAPGTMRGTIYYWAINTGRVMRITPGAAVPDDLFAGVNVVPPANGPCIACHSVSAGGSNVVVNAGHWDGTGINETSVAWDLVNSQPAFSGDNVSSGGSSFALAGISPDGKVMVQNWAPTARQLRHRDGSLQFVGWLGHREHGHRIDEDSTCRRFRPTTRHWSTSTTTPATFARIDWDPVNLKATNNRLLVAAGADANYKYIQFPTVTPDHQWVLYQRAKQYGSLGNPGDLYHSADFWRGSRK